LSDFPAQDAQIDAALADLRRRQRIADDVNLITWLALNGFEGPSYEEFASELAKYGFAVIKAWIMKGVIFVRCREKGLGGLAEPPLGVLTERDVADELASETVAKALRHFRDDVLMTARWDAARGASIKTFFIGQCLIRFPNIYRSWLINEVRGDEILLGDRSLPTRDGIGHVDPIDLALIRTGSRPPGSSNRRQEGQGGNDSLRPWLVAARDRSEAQHDREGRRENVELLPETAEGKGNRVTGDREREETRRKIEKSSLGTAEAQRLRATVSSDQARAITSRAATLSRIAAQKNGKKFGG
jgi:hypothetical protein